MPEKITVKAMTDAGVHPVHGEIVKGREYTIDPSQFAPHLFERPSKDWLAPWERNSKKTEEPPTDTEPEKRRK